MSYLPVFRTMSESEAHPLPRSFCVRSLADFVGILTVELLLCPVCSLRISLARTASLPSCPRALFVSPRAPSRPLSECPQFLPSRCHCGVFFFVCPFSSFGLLFHFVCLFFSPSFFGASSLGSGCRYFLGFSPYRSFVFCLGGRYLVFCLCLFLSFCLMFSSLLPWVFSLGAVVAAGAMV